MEEYIFPPAPNWYRSKILACAEDGTLAYGSRNHIVLMKLNQDTGKAPFEYGLIYNAHQDKINGVVFPPHKIANNWLCSVSDDSKVKIWDLETKTAALVNNTHGEGQKIICVDWSKADPNIIVSIDDSHRIVLWDVYSNTTCHVIMNKIYACTVACCPHDKNIIAIGSNSGLIYVIHTEGRILHRLRGHDTEVISLAWCPVTYNVFQPPEKRKKTDYLLASVAKGRLIYVWKAVGDGYYDVIISVPFTPLGPGFNRAKTTVNPPGFQNWICIAWPEATTLLCSSPCSELLKADLTQVAPIRSRTKSDKFMNKIWKLAHAEHTRVIFTVACSPQYWASADKDAEVENNKAESAPYGNEDFVGESRINAMKTENAQAASEQRKIIWTTGHDMQLIAYDYDSEKVTAFSINGGYVYCIAISPFDTNRIAIGLGDGTVRTWNTGSQDRYRTTTLWQKIGGKVLAIAWHPQIEGLLAFGTSEGRVGLYYTLTNKAPVTFRTRHHCVYSLTWAPPFNQTEQESRRSAGKLFLVACSYGQLLQYNPNAPEEDPLNLNEMLRASNLNSKRDTRRSECAWKPDNKYWAIGNEDGTVQIYSVPDLKLRQTIFAHKKLIQCMRWHPESTAVDSGYSPYRHWLATSSNESLIKVFDITNLIENEDYMESEGGLKTYTLDAHCGRVACTSWNPHIGGQLVSASYDGTARIWNVPAEETIAVYNEPCGCVLSCVWSPFNPDLILTGSSDFTLRVWRISNQKNIPVEKKGRRRKKLPESKMAKAPNEVKFEKLSVVSSRTGDKKWQATQKKEIISALSHSSNSGDCEVKETKRGKEIVDKNKTSKHFFHLTYVRDKQLENCYRYLEAYDKENTAEVLDSSSDGSLSDDQMSEDISKEELSVMSILSEDRKAFHKLIDLEVADHERRKRSDISHQMLLWKGNITEILREAARTRMLNDWLVSLAPMASHKVWLEMCSAYADQLARKEQYHKASSYLLACHKVVEAVELLATNKLYREAIVIAKCRLGPDDPIINDVATKWVIEEEMTGSFEGAAAGYIKLRRLPEAVQCLRKRKDPVSLKCGALIARKAEMNIVAAELASESMCLYLLQGECDMAVKITEEHPELKHLKLLLSAHRRVMELVYLNEGPKTFAELVAWIKGTPNNNFLPVLQLIMEHWDAELYQDSPEQLYAVLKEEVKISGTIDSREKLWLALTKGLALACLSNGERRYLHLCSVLSMCYQFIMLHPKEQHFLLSVCIWLSPQGPNAPDSVFFSTPDIERKRTFCSLRAYLCAALLDWLTQYFENKNEALQGSSAARECSNAEEVDDEQWIIPLEFLKPRRDDIISLESVQYYKDCVKIKKLEKEVGAYITKAKQSTAESERVPDLENNDNELYQTSVSDSGMNDNELPQTPVPDSETNDNGLPQISAAHSEKNDNELPQTPVPDSEMNDNELPQISAAHSEKNDNELPQAPIPDSKANDNELTKTSTVHLEKNDNELPQTPVPDSETNDNELPQTPVPDSETNGSELPQTSTVHSETSDNELPQTPVPNSETNDNELSQIEDKFSNDICKTFQELKKRKEIFEQLYISSPNPFITYCKLKDVLERTTEYQSLLSSDLLNDFELAWKHITEIVS